MQQLQENMIVQVQDDIILPKRLDHFDGPTLFLCPYCNKKNISITTFEFGNGTYTASIILLFLTFVLFFLPFILNQCQNRKQFCSVCGAQVGEENFSICNMHTQDEEK